MDELPDDARVELMDDASLRAYDAIVSVMEELDRALPAELTGGALPHRTARAIPGPAKAMEHAWTLGALLLRRAADGPEAADDAALDDARALTEDVTCSALAALAPRPPHRTRNQARRDREAAAELADAYLDEIALEELGAEAYVSTREEDDALALMIVPQRPEQVMVSLLEPLYQQLEVYASGDELLALELLASQWDFERWTMTPRDELEEVAGMMREQEWSLVERRSLALESTVAAAFAADPEARATLPPRQRALLDALVASMIGIFRVREHDGELATFEDVATGTAYRIAEPNDELIYAPGTVSFGRLIPLGDGLWLRSPGACLLHPDGHADATGLASILQRMQETGLERAIATEEILAAITREDVPRDMLPAPTRATADEILFELMVAMREAGLAADVPPEEAPQELRDMVAASPGRFVIETQLDRTLADWIAALGEQAHGGENRGARRRPSRKNTGSGGGKGKKQRKKKGHR